MVYLNNPKNLNNKKLLEYISSLKEEHDNIKVELKKMQDNLEDESIIINLISLTEKLRKVELHYLNALQESFDRFNINSPIDHSHNI